MKKNYFTEELSKMYENLFKEIENFKSKVEEVRQSSKNNPELLVSKTNNSNILVSVITPAYNARIFLPSLYLSLRKQSIAKNIEWIIVDDYSMDDSINFYEQLKNDDTLGQVKVFRNEKNLGAGTSLKRGFSLATSNVLAWVSADDFYVSEDKLEKDLDLIENGFDVVFSKETLRGTDIQNCVKISVPIEEYRDNYGIFTGNIIFTYFSGSSICIKKETYLEIGGINDFLINVDGDFDIWVKSVLLGKKIGFSDTVVFNHQHPGQTSKAFEKMSIGINITRISFIRFLKKHMENEKFKDIFSSVVHNSKKSFRDFLIYILLQNSNLVGCFNKKLVEKAKNYFTKNLLYKSMWLEEITGKQHHYKEFLSNFGIDLLKKHEIFRARIYELSDEFMKTEPFQIFSRRYKEISKEEV